MTPIKKSHAGDPESFPTFPKPSGAPNPWANRRGNPQSFPIEVPLEAPAPHATNTEELR